MDLVSQNLDILEITGRLLWSIWGQFVLALEDIDERLHSSSITMMSMQLLNRCCDSHVIIRSCRSIFGSTKIVRKNDTTKVCLISQSLSIWPNFSCRNFLVWQRRSWPASSLAPVSASTSTSLDCVHLKLPKSRHSTNKTLKLCQIGSELVFCENPN